ncbi:MAG: hypothetical protein R3C29_03940 [Dehalococcoidia bacterium]
MYRIHRRFVHWCFYNRQARRPVSHIGANHGFDEFHSYDDAQSLVGLSENDIVGRFGLPTTEKWEPEWDAAYWMRLQGFCMDGWYLVLNYDDSREVVAAGVVAD